MRSWSTVGLTSKNMNANRGGIDFNELFLRLYVDKEQGSFASYTIRFLEVPTPVLVHWGKKRVKGPDGKNILKDAPFPDAEFNRSKSRNSFCKIDEETGKPIEDPNCPWTSRGYSRQLRYLCNVLDRETGTVRILDAPATVLDQIQNFVEKMEAKGKVLDPSSWTDSVPDFDITVTRTSRKGGTDYKVTPDLTNIGPLSESDLDAITALNPDAKTKEEALKLWPIAPWSKPTPLATGSPSEAEEEDDDEEILDRASRALSKSAEDEFSGDDGEEEAVTDSESNWLV